MNFQDRSANLGVLPDNVIAFPGTYRDRPTPSLQAGSAGRASSRRAGPIAITGAELNARLLILFGICTTGAALALTAVHVLHV